MFGDESTDLLKTGFCGVTSVESCDANDESWRSIVMIDQQRYLLNTGYTKHCYGEAKDAQMLLHSHQCVRTLRCQLSSGFLRVDDFGTFALPPRRNPLTRHHGTHARDSELLNG